MRGKFNSTYVLIIILCLAVVAMGFGFASYTQNLSISGSATAKSAKWKVHFTSDYSETSGSVAATSPTVTDTTFSFNIVLRKPGDFYEANLVVKNSGDFNASLNEVTLNPLSTEHAKYLKYTVTVDGEQYTTTTSGLSKALSINGTHAVKVRVDYFQDPTDVNGVNLPQTDQNNITISGTLKYVQA